MRQPTLSRYAFFKAQISGRDRRSTSPHLSLQAALKRQHPLIVWPLATAIAALATGPVGAAGIVVDGKTATTIVIGADGKAAVGIATPVAGVSHNTYTDFNVGKPGVDLINTGVNARTIVNEVTGSNPSLIEGPLTVIGPRANLIIANSNGITVNGGRFQNTGTLALSTGKVSFVDFQPASGFVQRNVVLNTSMGQIEIGLEGLSGAFNSLELIAKKLKVSGKVENSFTNAKAGIRAVIGDSRAEFDTSVSPTDGLSEFVRYTAPATANAGAISIDITPLGSLIAGRIELVVTDQGAGARHAGSALATVGDFLVSASGDLQVNGGKIEAARDIVIATPRTVAVSRVDSDNAFAAGRNIDIQSSEVSIAGGTFKAGSDNTGGDITFGLADQNASGAMRFGGVESVIGYTPLTLTASRGIGVFGNGQVVGFDGATLKAQQNVIVEGATITLGTQTDRTANPKATQATLASTSGEVKLSADGAIKSAGGLVDGAAGVTLKGGSLTLDSVTVNGVISKSRITSSGGSANIATAGDLMLHASDIAAAQNVTVDAANVTLEQATLGQGSAIVALGGAVTIRTTGDLVNRGSLIQGNRRDGNNPASQGAVTLRIGGSLLNESIDQQTLAAIFGQNDDVTVRTGDGVTNHAARIISNAALTIDAQGDVNNVVDKITGADAEQRLDFQASHTELLLFTRSRSGFSVDYGSIPMPGQLAYLVADKDVDIRGRNIANRGGEIDSNAGSIHFTAQNKFLNEALASGEVYFERSCLIVCKTHADSNVTVTGGLISAAKDLTIESGAEATNIGGRVLALNDMTVTAPKITAQGITGYSAVHRDRGMKAWFGDTWAQIYAADVGGSFTASGGKLTINGTLFEDGGEVVGAAGTEITGGTVIIRGRHRDPVAVTNHLGLPSWLGQ